MEINDIKAIRIGLASPERIMEWSYGEVTKPETINYRRLRPEKDGLFCEAIFGPKRDWQCYCGKYKKIRYRGIVCEKCGVEVTHSRVRRERMGHITLAAPVAHIWYTRRSPSYLGLLLNVSQRNLDRVLYFAQYAITNIDENARQKALRHIDEEADREMARASKAMQDQIEQLDTALQEELTHIGEQREALRQEMEEKLEQTTHEIMEEAASLRERLDTFKADPLPEKLVFTPTDTVIEDKGEKTQGKHYELLNTVVQDKLNEIEAEIKAREEQRALLLDSQEELAKHKDSEASKELQTNFDQGVKQIRERSEEARDELEGLRERQLLNEPHYRELESKWGKVFSAGMGAEAVYDLVKKMDLDVLAETLRREIRTSRSKQRRKKAAKRLRIVEAFRASGNRPEWMILTVLPVIPPDLRPMVQLDGGRFATSDLNDLYRRVVNRNNRLKHLMRLQAPEVIIRNEKRMLQEAVDSLIDNSRRGKAISLRGRRQLKSLSDMLKGKQGRFRRNLLGKRVDYSGRSVIVVGPKLKLHQCGLPKIMALELFRPFVMHKLVQYNYAINVKGAKRLIEREDTHVWEVLEEVIKTRPVLLNRAPTLHRLGIQAFEPVLVDGSAIQLHPLACFAFNADFDGDQMAVHVPLSQAAVKEARELMLASRNLLMPSNGTPVVSPSKDMVLGCYYLTMGEDGCKGEGKVFNDYDEVALAYELGKLDLHAKIKFYASPGPRRKRRMLETTVGRVILNRILPEKLRFVNKLMDKGGLKELIADGHRIVGSEGTADLADKIKEIGFEYATLSGITIATHDLQVPEDKERIIQEVTDNVRQVERQYRRGLITENERYVKTVEMWTEATEQITNAVARDLDPAGALGIMSSSGATKGGLQPIRQLVGMRGLMADPSGRIIALPIRSNFREGLTTLEYFISTHGGRKGLADTALRTADAGYLTRRLVDVAQDLIVNEEDCGTRAGIWIRRHESEVMGEPFAERIPGRIAAAKIVNEKTGELIVGIGEMIEERHLTSIDRAGIEEVCVRSPMTCQLRHGICAKCYGRDLARGKMVEKGQAVGIIAAQSIGEPGTQLTLRTFHTGGVAGGGDITQGLPRVQELFEVRVPKGEAIVADISGRVEISREGEARVIHLISVETRFAEHVVPGNYSLKVEDGEHVEEGDLLAKRGDTEVRSQVTGNAIVDRETRQIRVRYEVREEHEYEVPAATRIRVQSGAVVEAGDQLTEGAKNPHAILRILGIEATQRYLLTEIQGVYRSQGVSVHDKHIETILRQMMRRVKIIRVGDTPMLLGDFEDRLDFDRINSQTIERGGEPATAEPALMGITKSALNTESFLSAASFQHTISVLASAAIEGKRDNLHGLKESVIIGKLIPAGTGFGLTPEKALTTEERVAAATTAFLAGTEKLELEQEMAVSINPEKELGTVGE